jgi:hypothetical protein
MRLQRMVFGALGFVLLIGSPCAAKTAATVTCTDGTTAKAGRGACSHHGGVAKGDTSSSAPGAAPANTVGAAGAAAKCKDGTYSHSTHNGACAHHGGVAEWLDGGGR